MTAKWPLKKILRTYCKLIFVLNAQKQWCTRKVVKNAILAVSASVKLNVLIIGGGRMGKALIKGLSHSTNHNVYVVESDIERKKELTSNLQIVAK